MFKKKGSFHRGEALVYSMRKDFLSTLEQHSSEFSKSQRRIAEYITHNYDKTAYMTASKLGSLVNVSESTVVRFANELGYDGYPEMQRAMQDFVRNKLTSFQRIEVTNKLIGDGDLLEKVLSADIDKIKHTYEQIDRKSFNDAIDAIVNARRIYIIGVRSSANLAGFLNYNFRMIFDDVRLLHTSSGGEMFEQLLDISDRDVLIAISFPRYSKRIKNAVVFAKNVGANVIAITDTVQSPIADGADQLLLAQSDMASFVDSLVAPLSILNAITVAVAKKKQDELTVRLKKLEGIWDEYEVYDKNHG